MSAPPYSTHRDIVIAERRAATGIDETMIRTLVRAFYAKVQADAALGPVFDRTITDWEPHLRTMEDFWSSVALLSGRYHGRPVPAHAKLDIGPVQFDRWLSLFSASAAEVCPPAAAAFFTDRARNIARSLLTGLEILKVTPDERRRSGN